MVHFDFILAIFMIPVIITERISDVIWAQAAQAPAVRWSSCEMSHVEILEFVWENLRPLLGLKKTRSNSQWKYLTLFPRCIAGYLTAYYAKKNSF